MNSEDIDIIEEIKIDEKLKNKLEEPKKFKVIFLNDDQTPMEWVVGLLITIFRHSETTAKDIMLTIHNEGAGIVGIYTYEIAEMKALEATNASRGNGFPLQIKLEAE